MSLLSDSIVRRVFIACTRLSSVMWAVWSSAIAKSLSKAAAKSAGLATAIPPIKPQIAKGSPALRLVIEIFFDTRSSIWLCFGSHQRSLDPGEYKSEADMQPLDG